MSIPQPASADQSKPRRFCGAAPGEQKEVPVPDLTLEGEGLGEVLPHATLEELATQTGTQDQRKRKLTCVVFFWLNESSTSWAGCETAPIP